MDHRAQSVPRELPGMLADERARALARIDALSRDIDDIVERSTDSARDDEHDPEGHTIAFERAQATALLDAARRYLSEIDHAEARMRRDEHCVCERCGACIPAERQLARPATRWCVECAM